MTINSILKPFFSRDRSTIVPGAHRLHMLLTPWLDQGILSLPCVLITGSNGKGTTCAYLESILRHAGLQTGLYTSPHLIHPSERIRLNGLPIDEETFAKTIRLVLVQKESHLKDASFFEILTAAALLIFFEKKIDFLVCEVGLGGLQDSTNALSPLVSAVTSVSLEHTDILGNSLYLIAKDKAFVARRNRSVVVGPSIQSEALKGIKETASLIGADVVPCLTETNFPNSNPNLLTALSVIDELKSLKFSCKNFNFNEKSIPLGVENMFWPGRFDVRKIQERTVIFDASHNPDGFEYLIQQYKNSKYKEQKCVILFSSLSDKNWKETFKKMSEIASSVVVTETPSDRKEKIEHFQIFLNSIAMDIPFYSIKDLSLALKKTMEHDLICPILITGSIAFIGTVMEMLGERYFNGKK